MTGKANNTVTFEVTKVTTATIFCSRCNGTGKEYEKVYHNRTIGSVCTRCRGTCKEKIKHETTVDLLEALQELGLIKPKQSNG